MTAGRVAVARWEDVPGERLSRYWDRLRNAGLEPIDFFEPARSLDDCAGLVLTGGIDVDPSVYGEARHPEVDEIAPERDAFELALLRRALEADMPVLAICRGHQLLNVCLGGSLLQHIEDEQHETYTPDGKHRMHAISLEPGSKLHAVIGAERLSVNTRHHQAVTPERLAPHGLRITALADDGIVEAIESTDHTWVIGVQWHPERDEEDDAYNRSCLDLFQAFAAATRRRTASRTPS